MMVRTHASGVMLSDAAFEVGLRPLRKAWEDARPWHVESDADRFIVRHAKTREEARSPSGRLRSFERFDAAQKLADDLNEEAAS